MLILSYKMNNYANLRQNMNKLSVKNLKKAYGTHQVLDGVSFDAKTGDVVILLGRSGSGKSTILRCLNLLELPNGGEVKINGFNFNYDKNERISAKTVTQLRAKVGMVFQQFNLWLHRTIIENLIIAPVNVFKQNKEEAIVNAEKLLTKVGILDKKNCYPSQLSGGQQQRAAIARALMMQPEIMLFDEPTSALDPEMKNEVLRTMQNLAKEGMTMIIATHELAFAREVASYIIFLENGKIIEQGITKNMLQNPQTQGLRNFLDAVHF